MIHHRGEKIILVTSCLFLPFFHAVRQLVIIGFATDNGDKNNNNR